MEGSLDGSRQWKIKLKMVLHGLEPTIKLMVVLQGSVGSW